MSSFLATNEWRKQGRRKRQAQSTTLSSFASWPQPRSLRFSMLSLQMISASTRAWFQIWQCTASTAITNLGSIWWLREIRISNVFANSPTDPCASGLWVWCSLQGRWTWLSCHAEQGRTVSLRPTTTNAAYTCAISAIQCTKLRYPCSVRAPMKLHRYGRA